MTIHQRMLRLSQVATFPCPVTVSRLLIGLLLGWSWTIMWGAAQHIRARFAFCAPPSLCGVHQRMLKWTQVVFCAPVQLHWQTFACWISFRLMLTFGFFGRYALDPRQGSRPLKRQKFSGSLTHPHDARGGAARRHAQGSMRLRGSDSDSEYDSPRRRRQHSPPNAVLRDGPLFVHKEREGRIPLWYYATASITVGHSVLPKWCSSAGHSSWPFRNRLVWAAASPQSAAPAPALAGPWSEKVKP